MMSLHSSPAHFNQCFKAWDLLHNIRLGKQSDRRLFNGVMLATACLRCPDNAVKTIID